MASVGAVQNRKKGKMETGRADWAPVGFLFHGVLKLKTVHNRKETGWRRSGADPSSGIVFSAAIGGVLRSTEIIFWGCTAAENQFWDRNF